MKNPAGVKEFGVHLRRLREAGNLSQQELADLADLKQLQLLSLNGTNVTSKGLKKLASFRGLHELNLSNSLE